MRFVVDETSWNFDRLNHEQFVEAMENHLDRLDDAVLADHPSCYSEDLFTQLVYNGKTFYELYDVDSELPISPEIRERIGTIFGRMPRWQELNLPFPTVEQVRIGDEDSITAPSIAWALTQCVNSSPHNIACIIIANGRVGGLNKIEFKGIITEISFLASEADYQDYFRRVILEATNSPNEMLGFCASAFPALDFAPGCLEGIKSMSKPYRENIAAITHHLATLSDSGSEIFSERWQDAPAYFGALGVNISDENGKTKQNAKAKRARTLTIGNEEIVFWWHSKIEVDRDRIHIYPDKVPAGGKILVGIFCSHLVT